MSNNTDNYEGKFVFIEHTNPDSRYYNGEYVCVRQTPGTLYCVKPLTGYGGHEMKSFSRIGKDAVVVVESWEDDEKIEALAKDQKAWGEQAKNPNYKKQWVEYVYENAVSNAEQVLRAIGRKRGVKITVNPTEVMVVTVPKGVRQISLKFSE